MLVLVDGAEVGFESWVRMYPSDDLDSVLQARIHQLDVCLLGGLPNFIAFSSLRGDVHTRDGDLAHLIDRPK